MNQRIPELIDSAEIQKDILVQMAETEPHFREIAGLKILVNPNVYNIGTDSRLLANTVVIAKDQTALDLCTGTGAIACKLASMGAKRVLGIDLNPRAVANAKANKRLLGLKNLTFRQGNMFNGIADKFDVITINPPYTDKSAQSDIDICFFDKDYRFIKSFFTNLREHLNPSGVANIAWSNIGSMTILPELAKKHGFSLDLLSQDKGRRGYSFYVYELRDQRSK